MAPAPEKTDGLPESDPDPDPNPTFPQFGRLPPELRLIIWELGLPQRIIPLSVLVLAQQHGVTLPTTSSRTTTADTATRKNDTTDTTAAPRTSMVTTRKPAAIMIPSSMSKLIKSTLARPSIISQVCQESRAVVFARQIPWSPTTVTPKMKQNLAGGSKWGTDSSPVAGSNRAGCIGWFDPRTDTLLVDCDMRGRYASLWERVCRELLFLHPSSSQDDETETAGQMMMMRGGDRGASRQGLCVAVKPHEMGRWFRSEGKEGEEAGPGYDGADESKPHSDECVGVGARGPRVGSMVKLVVAEVQVHVTPAEAHALGLFGLFAEERFAFLDLLDKAHMDRLIEIKDKISGCGELWELIQGAFKRWSKLKRSLDPRSAPLEGASEEGPDKDDDEVAQDQARSIKLGVWPVIHVERVDLMRMR